MENKNSQSKARENQMKEKLIQEILSIDRKVVDMTESVLRDPSLRKQFESESRTIADRLKYLADELERIDPVAYQSVSDPISESIEDLWFIEEDSGATSFRLAQVKQQMRLTLWQRLKNLWKRLIYWMRLIIWKIKGEP